MRHVCGCPLWGKDASDEMNWGTVSLSPTLLDYKSIMLTKEKNKQAGKMHRKQEKPQRFGKGPNRISRIERY